MTKTDLGKLLDGLAAEVPQYDVRDTVLRKARRRRQVVRLAPLAVAVVLVAGVSAMWIPLQGNEGGNGQRTTVPTAAPMTWLPREVDAGAARTPLPADRPVGPGALLYRTEIGIKYGLLTVKGEHYETPQSATTLSPDGRWLGYRDKDKYVLRDLTSTMVRELPRGYVPVTYAALGAGQKVPGGGETGGAIVTSLFKVREWSSDNRWLLLTEDRADSGPNFPFYRYDLSNGVLERIETPRPHDRVQAVLRTGEVLVDQVDDDARVVRVIVVDPVTGAQRNRMAIDLKPYLGPDDHLKFWHAGLDGTSLLIEWTEAATDTRKTMYVDLETGLPGKVTSGAKDQWLTTLLPEGAVTVERPRRHTFVLRLVDPTNGSANVISTVRNLPMGDEFAVQLRGS